MNEKIKIKPLNDNVIIDVDPLPEESIENGVIVPGSVLEKKPYHTATVISCQPYYYSKSIKVDTCVKPGDRVLFVKGLEWTTHVHGQKVTFIKENAIIGHVDQ